MIPLENSLSGSFHENYDLLMEFDFKIVGELILRIVHNLIGTGDGDLSGIKRIYSHPVVFEQCRVFLEQHPEWDLVSVQDTASSVRRVKEGGNPEDAAIASKEAAQLYKMPILKEGIETNPRNFTRYVIISQNDYKNGPKNKSSLVFSVRDEPGALYNTLQVFAENKINLTKLESRPIPDKPWEYLFYLDVNLDITEEQYKPLLEEVEQKTKCLKVLGSYSRGYEPAA